MAPAAGAAAPPNVGRRRLQSGAEAPRPMGSFPRVEAQFPWPWQGVDFSLAYVGFLGYIFIITTYVVNLGQVLMLTAIVGMMLGARDRWKLPPTVLFMSGFLVMVGLTYKSTGYAYWNWQPLEDLTKVMIIATVAVSVLNNRARIRFFMFFYLAAFALYPVRGGLLNWFVYNATTQGRVAWNFAFENPNDYAALLIFPIGLCLALFWTERSKLIKQASFLGLTSIPLIIFMTQSRGAILALAAGVFAYLGLQGKGRMRSIVGVAVISVVVVVFAPGDVWTRMSSLKSAGETGNMSQANDRRSAEQRLEIWKVAWAVHQRFPYTGVGWAGYPNAHMEFAKRSDFNTIARGARDAHNTYLTILAEVGWVGFALWSAIFGSAITTAVRAMRRVRAYVPEYAIQLKMLMLALLSYGVAAVFGSFGGLTFTYVNLVTVLALALVTLEEVDTLERGPRLSRSGLRPS